VSTAPKAASDKEQTPPATSSSPLLDVLKKHAAVLRYQLEQGKNLKGITTKDIEDAEKAS
jgi:hypothetical protein